MCPPADRSRSSATTSPVISVWAKMARQPGIRDSSGERYALEACERRVRHHHHCGSMTGVAVPPRRCGSRPKTLTPTVEKRRRHYDLTARAPGGSLHHALSQMVLAKLGAGGHTPLARRRYPPVACRKGARRSFIVHLRAPDKITSIRRGNCHGRHEWSKASLFTFSLRCNNSDFRAA